jgi:hypothetical protein
MKSSYDDKEKEPAAFVHRRRIEQSAFAAQLICDAVARRLRHNVAGIYGIKQRQDRALAH